MKKLFVCVFALLIASCTTYEEEQTYQYTHDNYCTMFGFIECLHESELFGIPEPVKPTYDEMMLTAASVIMTDTFGDTIGEGDCTEVYFLMYDYFKAMHPSSSVTEYLHYIITNEMY